MSDLNEFFTEADAQGTAIDDDDAQIGRRIADARIVLGDPTEVVAERVGVETETFEGWESGTVSLRPNQMNRVAGVLGISLSWLIMGRGVEPMSESSEIGRLRTDLSAALSALDDVVNELAVLDQRLAQIDTE